MVHSTFAQGHVAAGRETVSLGIPKSPSFHSGLDLAASASADSLKDACEKIEAFSRCSGGFTNANGGFCGTSAGNDEKSDEFLLNTIVFNEKLGELSRNCDKTNAFAENLLVQAANSEYPSVCSGKTDDFSQNSTACNEKTDSSLRGFENCNDFLRDFQKRDAFSASSSGFKFANDWSCGLSCFEIPKQRNASAVRAMQLGGHLPALAGDSLRMQCCDIYQFFVFKSRRKNCHIGLF